jgi:membrane protein DedA with SNARE-associated domain
MYYVGYFLSEKILRTGKLKFIDDSALQKTDQWFEHYGYWIILANRFLPGTRSVISFFSGVHELKIKKTFLFALISAFLWNVLIIYFGMTLGNNVELIDYYLTTYSNIVIGLTVLVILIFSIRIFLKRKNEASKDI